MDAASTIAIGYVLSSYAYDRHSVLSVTPVPDKSREYVVEAEFTFSEDRKAELLADCKEEEIPARLHFLAGAFHASILVRNGEVVKDTWREIDFG
ncbi:hypothetical protein NA78x_002855 [Anatilimnocola sp. NA78]|uniref:hypothetical protein n=1 Tax=Anatilimnocola sp. NA78 TaxID=3415683 RepID=UPI003CE44C84